MVLVQGRVRANKTFEYFQSFYVLSRKAVLFLNYIKSGGLWPESLISIKRLFGLGDVYISGCTKGWAERIHYFA